MFPLSLALACLVSVPELSASRVQAPIKIDGILDEPGWLTAPRIDGLKQIEPNNGEPARQHTEVRVLFDDESLYVAAILQDDDAHNGFRQPDLKRDFDEFDRDYFGVVLDTLNDGRNAFAFLVTPYGAMRDLQAFDDDNYDTDWDALWHAETSRTATGWNVELAIHWKTLRYSATTTSMGLQVVRSIRRLNEIDGWAPWTRPFTAYRMNFAGVLSGLEPPTPSLNLLLRPYATLNSSLTDPGRGLGANAGGDLRWVPMPNLTVDATANTDFSEVDVDRQVVNLSRFSVLYPERRQFFLESASLFSAGGSDSYQPFFSRRIGLTPDGRPLALNGGIRAVFRSEHQSGGAMIVHARETVEDPSTLFAVGRYNLHLGEQSQIGGLVTFRHDFGRGEQTGASNVVPVLDGLWRHESFSLVSSFSGSWSSDSADTSRPRVKKSLPIAATLRAYNEASWGSIGINSLLIGPDFDPRVGFINRSNQISVNPYVDFDLRPEWKPSWLRRINPSAFALVIHGVDDLRFQEGLVHAEVGVRFESNDEIYFFGEHSFQRLTQEFAPADNVVFKPGNYDYGAGGIYLQSDQSRWIAIQGYFGLGHYYSAATQFAGGKFRFAPVPHLALTVNYEMNRFVIAQTAENGSNNEAFTHLLIGEGRAALSPKIQLIGVAQYNTTTHTASANVRFAWEFRPLSFLFIVYDHRPSGVANTPDDQRLVLKISLSWLV